MEAGTDQPKPVTLPVEKLRLDADNPRLPEHIRGGEQTAILVYLDETTVLAEIGESMVENGFFQHEPLLVLDDGDGTWTVLEGNRRLATLMVLLQLPIAQEADLELDLELDSEPEEWKERLKDIPCFEVPTRDAVRSYLGFRHIGGMKPWSAQAKARYVYEEVRRAESADSANPFRDVARRIGSNSQGVRNSIYAYMVLLKGRTDAGIDIRYVMDNRFGVWQRALNSGPLRTFLSLGWPKSWNEISAALDDLDMDHLQEVLTDMTPNGGPPLLADSRDVTVYGQALENKQAYAAMRKYKNFEVARQIVEEAELPDRIRRTVTMVEAILELATRSDNLEAEVVNASDELVRVSRALHAVVKDQAQNGD